MVCVFREYLKDWRVLLERARRMGAEYRGESAGALGIRLMTELMRHQRGVARIEKDMCRLCGSTEDLQYDHEPQQARNPEESEVQPLCAVCLKAKSATDAKFDAGWRPFVSVFSPATYQGFHMQPRESRIAAGPSPSTSRSTTGTPSCTRGRPGASSRRRTAGRPRRRSWRNAVSYTHLRAHET